MSSGLIELVLVFGAVLALAAVDLIATKRDLAAKRPAAPPLESEAEPRVTPAASKTRSRKQSA